MSATGLTVLEADDRAAKRCWVTAALGSTPDDRWGRDSLLPGIASSTHSAADSGYVLVVDDDDQIRSFVIALLEDEGFSVASAANGEDAVAQAVALRPALVVLDIMLPDMNGDEVAQQLRARYGPDVPILVISADSRAEEKAGRAGAFAYLHKPFDLEHLLRLVRQGLAQ